jgi:hypothetical protein
VTDPLVVEGDPGYYGARWRDPMPGEIEKELG